MYLFMLWKNYKKSSIVPIHASNLTSVLVLAAICCIDFALGLVVNHVVWQTKNEFCL